MFGLSDYYLTSHIVNLNGLNTPWIQLSAGENLWVSVNSFECLLNVIGCAWMPLSELEHPLNVFEYAWSPLSECEYPLIVRACEHPWVSIEHSLNMECWWMPLKLKRGKCATQSHKCKGPVQIESYEHWHRFRDNYVMFQLYNNKNSYNNCLPRGSKRYPMLTWLIHYVSWGQFEKD